ncbi:MAG: endonuclease/exonuclease/phosphatase family protein [Clostridia bacterium]|nr:endonuclease/exonuclease/phosphatase family protein [Clostridia bacterium]
MHLKIMTYNIAGCRDYASDRRVCPEKTAEVIKRVAPAVCGLNEVDYKLPRSGCIKMAQTLGRLTGYESLFAPAITMLPGSYGNGLLSGYPVKEFEIFPIPDPTDRSEKAYYETRCILHATIDFDAHPADVYVSHFGLATEEKKNAVRTLCGLIPAAEHPVILLGDFNLLPEDPILDPIREMLKDTFDSFPGDRKNAVTFPSDPTLDSFSGKIDYIFVSRDIGVESAEIVETCVSDHKPYVANIVLP